jgi:hypothetical protein
LCFTDDNKEPDPQYEAFMADLGEADQNLSSEKPKRKHRDRVTRATRHRPSNNEELQEDDSNPADPSSTNSPDSFIRRQEFLAKVSAAAGSKYTRICQLRKSFTL